MPPTHTTRSTGGIALTRKVAEAVRVLAHEAAVTIMVVSVTVAVLRDHPVTFAVHALNSAR